MTTKIYTFADLGGTTGSRPGDELHTRRFYRADGNGGATSTAHYRAKRGDTGIHPRPTYLASVPPAPRLGDHREICPGNPENTNILSGFSDVACRLPAAELASNEAQNAAHIGRLRQHFSSPQAAQLLALFGIDPDAFKINLVRTDVGKLEAMSKDLAETERGKDTTHSNSRFD